MAMDCDGKAVFAEFSVFIFLLYLQALLPNMQIQKFPLPIFVLIYPQAIKISKTNFY
jgi:hypothetical protein